MNFFKNEFKNYVLRIVDVAAALHNGFMKAFGYNSLDEFKRVVFLSHVERNCEEFSN